MFFHVSMFFDLQNFNFSYFWQCWNADWQPINTPVTKHVVWFYFKIRNVCPEQNYATLDAITWVFEIGPRTVASPRTGIWRSWVKMKDVAVCSSERGGKMGSALDLPFIGTFDGHVMRSWNIYVRGHARLYGVFTVLKARVFKLRFRMLPSYFRMPSFTTEYSRRCSLQIYAFRTITIRILLTEVTLKLEVPVHPYWMCPIPSWNILQTDWAKMLAFLYFLCLQTVSGSSQKTCLSLQGIAACALWQPSTTPLTCWMAPALFQGGWCCCCKGFFALP